MREDNIVIAVCSVLFGVLLGVVLSSFVGPITGDWIKPTEPCVMHVKDARTEDEICAAWIEDGEVIIGPLWLKGE